jgi:hypothetical protein
MSPVTHVQHVGMENSCLLHVLARVTLGVYLAQSVVQASMPGQCVLVQATHCAQRALSVVQASMAAQCAPAATTQCVPTAQPVARESIPVLPAIPPGMLSAYLSTLSALLARFVELETTSAQCAPAATTQCVPTVQSVARGSMPVLPAIPPVMHSAQAAQLALSPQHLGPAAALVVQLAPMGVALV